MSIKEIIPLESLTFEQARNDFLFLASEISYHNDLYYDKSKPIISDAKYDQLYQRYESIAQYFPSLAELKPANKHLIAVGQEKNLKFFKVEHSVPMLSLKKSYSEKDLKNFFSSVYRRLKIKVKNSIPFILEPKIDGVSISIRYENGKFIHAGLRGDGFSGENVSRNIRTIHMIPQVLSSKVPKVLEVRGEIYISKSDFLVINEKRIESGKSAYSTPRNAVSGLIRFFDYNFVATHNIKFLVHGIGSVSEKFAESQSEMFEKISNLGFPVNDRNKICYIFNDILSYYHEIEKIRSSLEYDIDGVVYKVDKFDFQEKLGFSSISPNWAISHKFNANKGITRLLDIDIQIGRTGTLTPVARLEPINIGGVLICNATLHNEDYIRGCDSSGKIIREGRDIRIGDMVVVKRAGDVIPQVIDVLIEHRTTDTAVFSFPSVCPVCKSDAIRCFNSKTGKVDSVRRCTGDYICPAQQLEHLKYFVSRNAFNIEGLGDKQLDFFFKSNDYSLSIKIPADIFTLQYRQANSNLNLENIPGFAKLSVSNLYESINKRREISLDRFIFSLGIRNVGKHISKSLAKYYLSYDNFINDISNIINKINGSDVLLKKIPFIGDVIVESIVEFYKNDGNNRAIASLLQEVKIKPIMDQNISKSSSRLEGKRLVFTGTLNNINRDKAQELVEKLGAKVSNSVSSKTDIVIVGSNAGTKVNKADKLGIEIMYENDFLSLIKYV
ncbi:NAD-dependent DNA ligase LigA [Candidatus Liberibacter americanus]|uniref:DNA ligase n=1 Tax=Candidatus Liberibacter americanus str. Sao Paulo TaxID=1261131 RepID=U6B5N4_9HYPH|nr:NAD-dependent DNA ligase LigA [Candidatus Liberibacter americanus]AHA28133.1 NAD-dependent DNA ligase [Candidatus Liberibacter americanus str. Sao Paulo]EMS36020.1 NAD-dependent DNA ligase LigA [Candidatus Liberibacter americanus PW_SP]